MPVYDLTLPINDRTPVFPGDPAAEIVPFYTIEKDHWNIKKLTFPSHFGTHIDAPYHMFENGKKLTDFPMEKFTGEGTVIDVRGQKEIVDNLEKVHQGDIVFFYTQHIDNVYAKNFFSNNPVISVKTAQLLVKKKVKIVGIDSFSPDNEPFEVHRLLLSHEILIIENLVNLNKLIDKRFECYALPLKLENADGTPCRVIAKI